MDKDEDFLREKMHKLAEAIDIFFQKLFKRRIGFILVIFDEGESNAFLTNVTDNEKIEKNLHKAIDMLKNPKENEPVVFNTTIH